MSAANATSSPAPVKVVCVRCPSCGADDSQPIARGPDFEYDTVAEEFSFVECRACEVLYLNPRPDTAEMWRIYPENYGPYHFDRPSLTLKIRSFLERRKVAKLRRMVPESADILDVGCGGTGFLETLRRFGSPGWRLWGNDFSERVIEDLRGRGFRVLPGRFEEAAFPDSRFDAIFMKQVIEHLDAPQQALAAAARLLRPAGVLIVETPNWESWDGRLFRRRCWGGYHFPRHWTLFGPRSLTEAGARAGLAVQAIGFMLSPTFWVQSVHHLLKDRGWPAWIYGRFTHLNPIAMCPAAALDVLQRLVRGRTSNMRIVFRLAGGEASGEAGRSGGPGGASATEDGTGAAKTAGRR